MKRTLLVLLTFLFVSTTFATVTHYVSPTGGNVSPYTSWADAANNIQDAVNIANTGEQVLVHDGTYTLSSSISISVGITLKSVNGLFSTIIDGNNSTRCLYINHANAVVDGFTIINGYNPGGFGGGVDISSGGTVQNCLITNNQARDGGGVAIDNNGLVLNCVISNNSADNNSGSGYGGGVRMLNGGTTRGSLIHSNTSANYGGGINIWNAGIIQSCTITNNTAPNGAGVRTRNLSLMENTISYHNNGSDVQLSGAGYLFYNNCTPNSHLLPGSGNISGDPYIGTNVTPNPFDLPLLSPAIDAGVNQAWMTGAFDLDGNTRIINGTVDIGAYEFYLFTPTTPVLVYPGDFSVGVSIEPQLTWDFILGVTSYTLQLATDAAFTTNVTTYPGITSGTYTVTGLSNSTQYFWRVSATNAGGTSGYTSARSFTTTSAITPYLSWPIGGATLYSSSPFLYWWGSASTFDLLYSINSDMSNATIVNNINASFYSISGLTSGTLYYWQVRARTSTGAIAGYSVIETFSTQPGVTAVAPIPSWPIGGALVYSNSPTLYWYLNTNSTGLTYEIEYSIGALTGNPTHTGITSQNITLSGLTSGTTYNWQVRSTDGTTYSDWSVQESFETYASTITPVDVIPSWPIGGATVYTTSPILYWYLNSYATGLQYEVEYTTGSLTGSPTVTGIISLNTLVTGLTNGATYNWQVRSTDGTNYSAWSVQESFVVLPGSSGPSVPIPSWPIGNATVYVLTPTLYWYLNSYSTGLEYEVLYSTSSVTSGGVLQNGTVATTWSAFTSFTLPALVPGATYYWQVRSRLASNHAQISNYSSVVSFVTLAYSAPIVVLPGSPVGNVTIETDAPTLSWVLPTLSNSELTYELELANNSDMINAKIFTDLNITSYKLDALNSESKYFWRVRSKNEDGSYSQFSDLGSFNINPTVLGTDDKSEIPTQFTVDNNYPNPFNPTTTIKYGIPESAYVAVKIYNMLGQEIKVLVQSEKVAGTYEVMWNGSDNFGNRVSSGTYIFRVIAGNQIISKKMVLMK